MSLNTEQLPTNYVPGKSILSKQQQQQYEVNGYLLASGLIPDTVAEKAEKSMWELMEMDPDDPQTWSNVPTTADHEKSRNIVIYNGIKTPELLACATSEYIQATAELINLPTGDMHPPQAIHTQNLFPAKKTWIVFRRQKPFPFKKQHGSCSGEKNTSRQKKTRAGQCQISLSLN